MAIGCIKGVAVLSGFSYEKIYGCFTGTKTKKNGGDRKARLYFLCMLFSLSYMYLPFVFFFFYRGSCSGGKSEVEATSRCLG